MNWTVGLPGQLDSCLPHGCECDLRAIYYSQNLIKAREFEKKMQLITYLTCRSELITEQGLKQTKLRCKGTTFRATKDRKQDGDVKEQGIGKKIVINFRRKNNNSQQFTASQVNCI